jgi:superfamily I DNA and/or RNA helicase
MNLKETIAEMKHGIQEEVNDLKRPSPLRVSNLRRNGLSYVCSCTKKISGDAICGIRGKEYSVEIETGGGVLNISGLEDLGDEEIHEAHIYQDESALTQKVLDEFVMLNENHLHADLFEAKPLIEGDEEYENPSLNDAQKETVAKALTNKTLLAVGPAGTGKTKTIVATIKAMVDKGLRVLVCSHANLAVEGAMESLMLSHEFEEGDVVCGIKTDSKTLREYSAGKLSAERSAFLEDELDELEEITKSQLLLKKEIEEELKPIQHAVNSGDALISNLKREEKKASAELLLAEKRRQTLHARVEKLNNNKLLSVFTSGSKREKLSLELEQIENLVKEKSNEAESLKKRLIEYKEKLKSLGEDYESKSSEIKKISENLAMVSARKKEIRSEIENILSEDYYTTAKVGAVTLMKAAINKKIRNAGFDVLIVDEVSMAPVPALLLAMEAVSQKVVLFGDPMQLPPIAKKSRELRNSIFDKLEITDSFLSGCIHPKCVFLDTQFRCHPEIAKLSSSLFYGGLLKNGRVMESNKKAMWIKNTHGMGARFIYKQDEGGYVNTIHQQVVLAQVESALKRGQRSIGVICPFRAQANAIKELYMQTLARKYPDADFLCSTIHSFQGQEKDVVIFDFMYGYRPNKQEIPKMLTGDMTSATAKLLNVATTRARDFFVLVCDLQYVKSVLKGIEGSERMAIRQWLTAIEELAFSQKEETIQSDAHGIMEAA